MERRPAALLSHLKGGVRRGGEGGRRLALISRPCLPISPLLSALLLFLFFNVSFAYFWLAVRLSLEEKNLIDRIPTIVNRLFHVWSLKL